MSSEIPDKVYFRIGEVAEIIGVETHVLRFWEAEFPHIKPVRASSNQRLYRRKELDKFLEIKRLLYDEKYTIAGARKRIGGRTKNSGVEDPSPDSPLLNDVRDGLLEIKKLLESGKSAV